MLFFASIAMSKWEWPELSYRKNSRIICSNLRWWYSSGLWSRHWFRRQAKVKHTHTKEAPKNKKNSSCFMLFYIINIRSIIDVSEVPLWFDRALKQRQRKRQSRKCRLEGGTLHSSRASPSFCFLYISLPSLNECDVKKPNSTFRAGCKHFPCVFLKSRKNC